MDHLPKPASPIFTYPTIHFVCFEEYDRQDFHDYPVRAGWSYDEIFSFGAWDSLGKEGHRTFAQAKSFLQTWLFFGSLHAIFGDFVIFDDFIDKHTSSPPSIHTRNLLRVAEDFLKRTKSHTLSRDALLTIAHSLGVAYNVYAIVVSRYTFDPNFILSLGLLLDFLEKVHTHICQQSFDSSELYMPWRFPAPMVLPNTASEVLCNSSGKVDFLDSELASSGWCPRLVGRLRDEQIAFRYYALFLGPPDDQRNHGSCTLNHCVAYQINKNKYIRRHVDDGCSCGHEEPDVEQICSILRSGHIPLIRTKDPVDEQDSLILSTAMPEVKYVAISHVWSDGLGNPWKNSIAHCQMRKIRKAVQSIPDSRGLIAFWLDTLCCPVKPKEIKTLAIRKMRETYQQADVVLVLDSQLEKLSLKETSLLEITMRIFTSGWASRLWTWQEGALSTKLYILLSDGVLDFEELFHFLAVHESSLSYSGILSGILSVYGLVRSLRSSDRTATAGLCLPDIGDAIAGRTTSVAEDEPICIGAMMNLELQTILDAKPEDRMCAFWKLCPSVPIAVIFSKGPRITKPGFRWAPPTLLEKSDHVFVGASAEGHGIPSSCGLRVRCRGFLLQDAVDRPINFSFWIRDASGGWPFHVCDPVMGRIGRGVFQPPVLDDRIKTYTHAALLVRSKLDTTSPSCFSTAALVYVYANENGVLYVRGIMRMVMESVDHPLANSQELDEWKNEVLNPKDAYVEKSGYNITIDGVCRAVESRALSDDQEWCID